MIKELDIVALTCSVPEYGLEAGDVGTVVMVYEDGKGFTVEFTTVKGKTIAIATVEADAIRSIDEQEVSHTRQVA